MWSPLWHSPTKRDLLSINFRFKCTYRTIRTNCPNVFYILPNSTSHFLHFVSLMLSYFWRMSHSATVIIQYRFPSKLYNECSDPYGLYRYHVDVVPKFHFHHAVLMMTNFTHAFTDICFLLSFNHRITSLTFEFLW